LTINITPYIVQYKLFNWLLMVLGVVEVADYNIQKGKYSCCILQIISPLVLLNFSYNQCSSYLVYVDLLWLICVMKMKRPFLLVQRIRIHWKLDKDEISQIPISIGYFKKKHIAIPYNFINPNINMRLISLALCC
jgi:hypothetical protein